MIVEDLEKKDSAQASATVTPSKNKIVPSRSSSLIAALIGVGLLFFGFLNDGNAQTIMQQIYAGSEICSGCIVVALAMGIDVLITIAKNQSRD